ncbi:MAG TPA: hypothetical protein VIM71_06545 [Lacunisphaera sp.]
MKLIRLLALSPAGVCLAIQLAASPITPTSYSYNQAPWGYWDDTGSQLTDGLYNALIPGVNLATPDAYNWVGFAGGTPSVTFNFGASVTINSLALSMANWTPAAVYLPNLVVINSSNFAVNPGSYPNMDHVLLSFNGSWTGNSLTLTLTPAYTGVWTFVDEVTFTKADPTTKPANTVPDASATLPLMAAALSGLFVARKKSRPDPITS